MNEQPLVYVSTPRDATHYKMDHPRRGMALIFNHQFYEKQYVSDRAGTIVDCETLQNSLKRLGFDVKVHHNFKAEHIESRIKQVSGMDHKNYDCLIVVMLTHGDLGKLYAYDKPYNIDMIFSYFTAERCKTLVGKPKLFFIQACQGGKFDSGISVNENMDVDDNCVRAYRIPAYADFLVAHATIPGFVSWRNKMRGSWFIEALCKELDSNGTKYDLFSLLTFVARNVAINCESENFKNVSMHQQKQIPCTTSMLMYLVKFTQPRSEGTIDEPLKGIYSASMP